MEDGRQPGSARHGYSCRAGSLVGRSNGSKPAVADQAWPPADRRVRSRLMKKAARRRPFPSHKGLRLLGRRRQFADLRLRLGALLLQDQLVAMGCDGFDLRVQRTGTGWDQAADDDVLLEALE